MSHKAKFLNRRIIGFGFMLLIGCFALEVASQSKKPLTNEDIVKMSKKLGENVIITAIETSQTQFDTSVDALIKLKDTGVSDKIIEAMQKAEAKKNQPRTEPTPTIPIAPSPSPTPIPKPAPVATKDNQFFTFELEKCSISGSTVACFLQITNNGQDRDLQFGISNSGLIDNDGNTARAEDGKIANTEHYNRARIPTGVTVKAWIRIEKVASTAQRISRLVIHIYVSPGESTDLEFRDIPFAPITKRQSTSVGTSGNGEQIPETAEERRRREQKEEERRRKIQNGLNDILKRIRRRQF